MLTILILISSHLNPEFFIFYPQYQRVLKTKFEIEKLPTAKPIE